MKQYKIFKHPGGELEAVKQGWSWPAFLFSCFWAIAKKMYLTGIALFALSFILGTIMGQLQMGERGEIALNIISIAVSIIFGLRGNEWREATLHSNGYEEMSIIEAATPQSALAKFQRQE